MLLPRFVRLSAVKPNHAHTILTSRSSRNSRQLRNFSSPPQTNNVSISQPTAITKEIAHGIQEATKLFMQHGIGMQKIKTIATEAENVDTLVSRWQRMMEAYLGTQVHVLAGLGYYADESGLHRYNQQLATFIQGASPSIQEDLRVANRDLWRFVLSSSFNISLEDITKNEMNIVDARNAMHKVSLKMIEPAVLESIAQKCSSLKPTGNVAVDMAQKHQIVQETLVHNVYIGGEPSLVSECGFESGEKGYVAMQCVMAEHQSDPLIAQYISSAMMQVLKSAGIDMSEIQKAGEAMKSDS